MTYRRRYAAGPLAWLLMSVLVSLSGTACANNGDPVCDWQRVMAADEAQPLRVVLKCSLRTINNADSVISNLTSAQMDMITSLTLKCSDVIFFESSLENSFLTQLRRLNHLDLEYCKIKYVPPAVLSTSRELKKLRIRTHNTDWSAMTMDFHSDSLRGLVQLRELDLSDNNIWNLPKELFCPLVGLANLNLTKNRLQDVFELGFSDWGNGPTAPGKTCNTALEDLNLANNDIISMPDNGLTSLRALKKLYLQENQINQIADRAFVGLTSLNVLNVSSNRLSALPPELFHSTRYLREIYLHNNSINVLAPGLLEGLDQLLVLDMSHNELTSTWVNRDTFSGLVRLVVLNLGHNQLSKIDSHVFQDLYSLQILNLEHNNIEMLADQAFAALSNLHALTLSFNKLKHIEPLHFSGLYVINQLFLDRNRIDTVDEHAFQNCTNLHDLGLYGNALRQVPAALSKLHMLKTLDLGGNVIRHVKNSSFDGLDLLYNLILSNNEIGNLTANTFSTMPLLQVLNLAFNRLTHVDQQAFGTSNKLHAIRLDGNALSDINGMFDGLSKLVWLNVSDNQIANFDYSYLPSSVEWLDMHKNAISNLGNYYVQRDTIQIKMLDASFNRLTEITDTSIPDSVENVFLNNNLIHKIKINTFLRKANLSRVVLYANKMEYIDIASLRLDPVPENKELPQFYIGDNPLKCDCTTEWLQRINQLSVQRQHPRIMDMDSIMCRLVHSKTEKYKPLLDLKPSQFLCEYESHCFSVCECCDFDACDCEMTCPDNCTCYHDHVWSSNIVDCSNAGYKSIPARIPMDATEIYLDGNDLGELSSHVFLGKKKLQVLYMNNSNVVSLHNKTFNGVPDLRVLHIENNQLDRLNGGEFETLPKLTELYLNDNRITSVANRSFASLKSLQVLHLENNQINEFRPWQQLNAANTLTSVSLAGNTWLCDCDVIVGLEGWLKNNDYPPSTMLCSDKTTPVAAAIQKCQSERDTGPSIHRPFYNTSVLGTDYVPFVAASLALFIVVFVLVALALVFREDLCLWAHSRYGVRVCKSPSSSETDKLYDAYMVYSIKDEEFVNHILSTSLERFGYSLCLHYRDIHVISPAYLMDSFLGASDASKRIIVVLSLSFLQNEWEKPVFRTAFQACLERAKTKKQSVVVLLTTTITPDRELQALLKSCDVVTWGEKRFWDRLRYLMPDPKPMASAGGDLKKVICDGRPVARYTAAPTSLEAWIRMSPASVTQSQAPTQSSCMSEESSQRTTDEDEDPSNHSYVSIDYQQRHKLHHVYSSIPDPIYNQAGGRTYFV
ncbi:hypothetical protein QTP88_002498 [Uroleucon formosanum]